MGFESTTIVSGLCLCSVLLDFVDCICVLMVDYIRAVVVAQKGGASVGSSGLREDPFSIADDGKTQTTSFFNYF